MPKYDSKISKKYENLFEAAKAFRWTGRYDLAEPQFLKCHNYYNRTQNKNKLKLVIQQLIDIYMNTERYNDALVYIKEMEILNKNGLKIEIANNLNDLGRVYQNTGEFDLATKAFTQSLNISEEVDYHLGISIALTNLGVQYRQEGKFEKALGLSLQSETICQKNGFTENLMVNLLAIASLYFDIGDIENSIIYTKKSEKLLKFINFDDAYIVPQFFGQLSNIYYAIGDIEKSLEILKKGIKICKTRGFKSTQAQLTLNLGVTLIMKDDFDEAYNTFIGVLEIFKEFDNKRWIAKTLSSIGSLFAKKNEFSKAIKFFKDSQEIAKAENDHLLMVANYRKLGHTYLNLDNHYESYRNYTQCLFLYEEILESLSLPRFREAFRDNFNDLPKIIHSLNIIIESGKLALDISEVIKTRDAVIKTCEKSKIIDPKLPREELIEELQKNIRIINELKGPRLETDSRKLFRRELGFDIEDSGKNWEVSEESIKFLINEGCQKDSSTKTIEIDIFGNKKENEKLIYILGECKFRNKKMSIDEVKCFLIKCTIISRDLIKEINIKKLDYRFYLVLVSFEGFPVSDKIEILLEKYWDFPKDILINSNIDLIEREQFIKLLKKNNMPIKVYKDQK